MRKLSRALLCLLLIGVALSWMPQTHARLVQAADAVRFEIVDVFASSAQPLAAYQFELRAESGDARIVGVEGGEHAAFQTAPYYDPAALRTGRIIIGAFSTANDLPPANARTRVARVHLEVHGGRPIYTAVRLAGATHGAVRTDVQFSTQSRPTP